MVRILPIVIATWVTGVALPVRAQGYVVRSSASPCLNIRAAPDTDAQSIACLQPGTELTELESIPYWRKVQAADGTMGWAAKKFLESSPAPPASSAPTSIPPDAWLEVHFVDVGQGDGIWIHTFDDGVDGNGIFEGRNIVIDGGPDSSDSKNAMLAYMRDHAHHGGIIDALFVTHPHNDHYPGAEGLLRHFDVKRYFDPGYPKGGVAYPAFINEVRAEVADGQPIKVMLGRNSFEALDWGSELTAEVLYAYPGSPAGLGTAENTIENNSSIVLKLTYGSRSFIFMGDAEGKDRHDPPDPPRYVEKILLDTVLGKLKADVLKPGHHGSETSSSTAFIQAVDPSIVVVDSGRKSFSGTFLPDASTLRRYCCHNSAIRIYRTDQNDEAEGLGTTTDTDGDHVVIRTNGTDLEVKALEGGSVFSVSTCSPVCGS